MTDLNTNTDHLVQIIKNARLNDIQPGDHITWMSAKKMGGLGGVTSKKIREGIAHLRDAHAHLRHMIMSAAASDAAHRHRWALRIIKVAGTRARRCDTALNVKPLPWPLWFNARHGRQPLSSVTLACPTLPEPP